MAEDASEKGEVAEWSQIDQQLQHHLKRVIEALLFASPDPLPLTKIREVTAGTHTVALEITGTMFTSHELADFLTKRELEAREVSFLIGGPDGLPQAIRQSADYRWSLSRLTLPHDLAMVVTLEALFRASTINARLPYHR